MGSATNSDERAERVATLRAAFDSASATKLRHAIGARSRALLDLILSLLEGKEGSRLCHRDP